MMRWIKRPIGSNWGEFGGDDQVGRLNLITPERRLAAIKTVEHGLVFPLSLPLDYPGGNAVVSTRHPPKLEATIRTSGDINYNYRYSKDDPTCIDVISDDRVILCTQYSTQWDSFAHWGQEFDADDDGIAEIVYYNGFSGDRDIIGPEGVGGPYAFNLGIERIAGTCVQGRGILLDFFELDESGGLLVGYESLMRAMDRRRVDVRIGDFLCIYTGWADAVLSMGKNPDVESLNDRFSALDGRDGKLLNWISDSGIVAICGDNVAVEGRGLSPIDGLTQKRSALPLHEHCLFKSGILLGEMWYFRDLNIWLRENDRNDFLLTAPPLNLPGAVGSPLMPVATV